MAYKLSNAEFREEFKRRCFRFSVSILNFVEELRKDRKNWPLIDQLVRAGTSIGANVVEGGYSSSSKEFINYFRISLKSAVETLYWLSLIKELNPDLSETGDLLKEGVEIKNILATIILNVKNRI